MPRVYNNKNSCNKTNNTNHRQRDNDQYGDNNYRLVRIPRQPDSSFQGSRNTWNTMCNQLCEIVKSDFQSDHMYHVCQQIHRGLSIKFNIRQEINILRIISRYESQFEDLFKYYNGKYYNGQVNKYPRFSLKIGKDNDITKYTNDESNCPICKVNFQFSLIVDGDLNLHKFVMTAEKGVLRCIFAYEEESTKAERKEQNQTDKFVHYIPYTQNENNYNEFYLCQVDGKSVSWDLLDTNPADCSFLRVDYAQQATLDENQERRLSVIEQYRTKLTENKNQYIKQTYIRVYAYMKFRYIWEFYKIEEINDPRLTQMQQCMEFIVEVLSVSQWDTQVISRIIECFMSSNRYERNFFQNVVVEEIKKTIKTQEKEIADKTKDAYIYDECFAAMDEVIQQASIANKQNNSNQSSNVSRGLTDSQLQTIENLKKLVSQAEEQKITITVQHPYLAGVSYQVSRLKLIGDDNFKFYMKERYIQTLDYCISDHTTQFKEVFGSQCGKLINKIKSLRQSYAKLSSIIVQDLTEKDLYDNRKYRKDEMSMLKQLLPTLRLMQSILLRNYVTSYGKVQDGQQTMTREKMLEYFRYFSCRVYVAELRLKYLEADYDLSKVDPSTINCDTSVDLSETMSNIPLMLRDYETIFSTLAQTYEGTPNSALFPALTADEIDTIKKFIMDITNNTDKK